MPKDVLGRVALLWRGDRRASSAAISPNNRLRPIFDALAGLGIAAEAAVYSEDTADEVREQLAGVDGVLVWVDPISGGDGRAELDELLRDVASRGTWVSAHPDTIREMGTKEVLYRTRTLGWGVDTDLYTTPADLAERLPARLASRRPRVLKQHRGNGGIGVWKVALLDDGHDTPDLSARVRIQHAQMRDAVTEDVTLGTFLARCDEYFAGTGRLIDQPFVVRLPDGMIRAYMVQDEVVGFARQHPDTTPGAPPPEEVLGLPGAKTMSGPDDPSLARLRASLEDEWIPGLHALVDVAPADLPLLWDADFLFGPRTTTGDDSYVLCEINVSAVSPFPAEAVPALATAVQRRLRNN